MGNFLPLLVPIAVEAVRGLFQKPRLPPPAVATPPPQSGKTKEEMIKEARTKYGIDVVNCYNFAIVGQAGSGKSSLVNSFRGLRPGSPNAAKVGEVECTTNPTAYVHPEQPHIVFWDLPGGGTQNHPSETYFDDKCLYAFDCLMVVTNQRFTQIDLDIASLAKQWGVPVFFVRSKSDMDLESKFWNKGLSKEAAIQELISEVGKNIRQQLQTVGMADRSIYIVSSRALVDPQFTKIDEDKLIQDFCTMAVQRRR